MRVADSGQTDAMEAGFGDSGLRSIWDDESILHPISKDLNPASVLAAETEKALVGGFDQSEDSNDDFFELLGKIDSQRQSESSDLAGLEKDSLATLNQRDELAQRRARKSEFTAVGSRVRTRMFAGEDRWRPGRIGVFD
jgi:hypothetical protein